jgi:Cu2+-exporting ATPase
LTAAAPAETGLFLDGLHCAGCVSRVEKRLRQEPGVRDASVSFTTHRALVRYDPARLDVPGLVSAVESLGYAAVPFDPDVLERPAARDTRRALIRVLVAAFLAGNVMLLALGLYLAGPDGMESDVRRGLRWLAMLLSFPAVTWCAAPFWRGAFAGLRRGEISMDVPIVLGLSAAFGAGLVGTWHDAAHVFVDSAAMIVFLILLGRTLERGGRARAAGAVERLAALTPPTALRKGSSGLETVPAEDLRVGDRVVVAPGQAVPADGVIVVGRTEVDEALLTGESLPVLRGVGDPVTGGSHNVAAEVEVEIRARAGAGVLARMSALLERAEAQRPAVQRLADRVARVFAPAVLSMAVATALWWWWTGHEAGAALLAAASVLIVACPCALGLATPAAVTAALGRAAAAGMLFKSGEAFERCARVQAAVLDKTGTLSEGRLAVAALESVAGVDEKEVLAVALQAEGASIHPVAEALRTEAARHGLEPPADSGPHELRAGRGVIAGDLRVGTRAFLEEAGIEISAELDAAARRTAAAGSSLAFVARGDRALGLVALHDPARPDAAEAMTRLRDLGLRLLVVSGDHAEAVRQACQRSGISEFRADTLPEGKVEVVQSWQRQGCGVLVAGDGVNDAAALAAADVGIAMACGADVSLHAADVVVPGKRLCALADAIELSRTTLRRIRENLGFALAYNAVAVPLAMAGVLSPLGAAAAMSASSLVVTANALRLLRWSPGR